MLYNYRKAIFTTLLLTLLSFTGFSQNKNNQITGKITDTNASIVSGANITAQNKASGKEFKTQTAVTGDVGVVYKVIDSVSLTARIGRSFRVPNLFDRFYREQFILAPARGRSFIAGTTSELF